MNADDVQAERTIHAELMKLERLIAERKKSLQALLAQVPARKKGLQRRPRRYSLEFEFEPSTPRFSLGGYDTRNGLQPQTRSFTVDGGRPFIVDAIDTSLRVMGIAAARTGAGLVAGQACTITLPYGKNVNSNDVAQYRNDYLEFFWSLRDTTTDRQFQNMRQPSVFLLSGTLSPATLPLSQTLPGGSEVEMTVEPTFALATIDDESTYGKFFAVRKYTLQVSFHGREVMS
jgi:hypothetical protein